MSERSDTSRQPAGAVRQPGTREGAGSPQVSEAEARRVAEEAREAAWLRPSFGKQLFLGDFQPGLIHPYPEPDPELEERGKAFCERLTEFCAREVNGAVIENDARIPDEVVKGLAALGASGSTMCGSRPPTGSARRGRG